MNFSNNFEITTERLVLSPMSRKKLESAFRYFSDKDNIKLMVFLPHESLEETRKYLFDCEKEWEKFFSLNACDRVNKDLEGTVQRNISEGLPGFLEFAIVLNGVHIGAMTLYILEDGKAGELGWVLGKEYRNKGYVTEAAKALISFARNIFGISRVIAQCDSENFASRRVAEKLGMVLTKTDGVRKNRGNDEERAEFTYEIGFD